EGENLYNIDLQKEAFRETVGIASDTISFSPFRHLPAVAWAFSFVPGISLELIYKIALVVNIILLTVLIFLLSSKFTWIKKFNIFLPLLFVSVPVLASIRNGQLSILFTLLFVGIFFLIQKTKYFWAGILSGLIAIKLQMLLAVPFIFFSIKKV